MLTLLQENEGERCSLYYKRTRVSDAHPTTAKHPRPMGRGCCECIFTLVRTRVVYLDARPTVKAGSSCEAPESFSSCSNPPPSPTEAIKRSKPLSFWISALNMRS